MIKVFSCLRVAFISICILSVTGCGTIFLGTTEKIEVISTPAGATVTVSNGESGTTPMTFKKKRKKAVLVRVKKEGFETEAVTVVPTATRWFDWVAGYGGLIGIPDALMGGAFKALPNPVTVKLIPEEPTPKQACDVKN